MMPVKWSRMAVSGGNGGHQTAIGWMMFAGSRGLLEPSTENAIQPKPSSWAVCAIKWICRA
jgi:hypothetical protein